MKVTVKVAFDRLKPRLVMTGPVEFTTGCFPPLREVLGYPTWTVVLSVIWEPPTSVTKVVIL